MNYNDNYKQHRKDYRNGLITGFLGGHGLLSALFLEMHNSTKKSNPEIDKHARSADGKGPESFDIIE